MWARAWAGGFPEFPLDLNYPVMLSVLDSSMDQYKFGTVKLKKTIFKPSGMCFCLVIKGICFRDSIGFCLKVILVVFCTPKLAVISWSFTAGGQCDSFAHSHWEALSVLLASRNLAMHVAHRVEAELLYHSIQQNYLYKMKWNCDVTARKGRGGLTLQSTLLAFLQGGEPASPRFRAPQSLLLLFLSVLTSQSMSRHKTDIAGHATSGFQQILYLE